MLIKEHALLAGKRLPSAMAVAVLRSLPDFLIIYFIILPGLRKGLAAALLAALSLAGRAGPEAAGQALQLAPWLAAAAYPLVMGEAVVGGVAKLFQMLALLDCHSAPS